MTGQIKQVYDCIVLTVNRVHLYTRTFSTKDQVEDFVKDYLTEWPGAEVEVKTVWRKYYETDA